MGYLIGVPLLALLAVLQSTILSRILLLDGRPDLVLLAVVGWGLAGRSQESLVWAMVGGLFLDLLSGVPLGTTAIALVVVAYVVSFSEGRFWEAHFLMPLGVTLFASLFYHAFGLGVMLLSGRALDLLTVGARVILPSTFLNLVLALPASQLAEGLRESLFPPEVSL
jgi:rod shape-determining protein MreD